MTWFEDLAGVPEGAPDAVRAAFDLDGEVLIARATGRRMRAGALSIPSLAQLRSEVPPHVGRPSRFRTVVGDVQALHADPSNRGALFQVASQFNLLEMIDPLVTPADGITRYAYDRTQGPACAMACGAGTIWRNYFTGLSGGVGQTDRQIDTLADLGAALGNRAGALWSMTNGYALPHPGGLQHVAEQLNAVSEAERDALRGLLRVGLQTGCEVTLAAPDQIVSQIYCSSLPVAYGNGLPSDWEPFARLVLEASYEATVLCAQKIMARGGSNKLFLTLLGGGAFGNEKRWILDALARALGGIKQAGLDVAVVSYGHRDVEVEQLMQRLSAGA